MTTPRPPQAVPQTIPVRLDALLKIHDEEIADAYWRGSFDTAAAMIGGLVLLGLFGTWCWWWVR